MLTRSRSNKVGRRGGVKNPPVDKHVKLRGAGPAGLRINTPAIWFLNVSRWTARASHGVPTLPDNLARWLNEALERDAHRDALLSQYVTRLLKLCPQLEEVWKFMHDAVEKFHSHPTTGRVINSTDWIRTVLELGADVRRQYDYQDPSQNDEHVRSLGPLVRELARVVPRETLCPLVVESIQQELARTDMCNFCWITSLTGQLLRSISLNVSHETDSRFLLLLLQLNASASHRAPDIVREVALLEYFWTLYEDDEICVEGSASVADELKWDATPFLNHTEVHDLFAATWKEATSTVPWSARIALLVHILGSTMGDCKHCQQLLVDSSAQRIVRPVRGYLQGITKIARHTAPTLWEEGEDSVSIPRSTDVDMERAQCPFLVSGSVSAAEYTLCCAQHATFRQLTLYCEDLVSVAFSGHTLSRLLESDLYDIVYEVEVASNSLIAQSRAFQRFQVKQVVNPTFRHMWTVTALVCQVLWALIPTTPTSPVLGENLRRVTSLQRTCISLALTRPHTAAKELLDTLSNAYPAAQNCDIRHYEDTLGAVLGVDCLRELVLRSNSLFAYEDVENLDPSFQIRVRRNHALLDTIKYDPVRLISALGARELHVHITGEPGVGTGVIREWLKLVGEQLMVAMGKRGWCMYARGMWALSPCTDPSKEPTAAQLRHLKLLGYVMAGCIALRTPFPVALAPSLVFSALGVEWPREAHCDMKDLIRTASIEVDPETVAGLAKMLDMDDAELECTGLDTHDLAPALYTTPQPLTRNNCNAVVRHVLHQKLRISEDVDDERLSTVAAWVHAALGHNSQTLALMGPWHLLQLINGDTRPPTLVEWRSKVYRNMNLSGDQWSILWLAMAGLSDEERTQLFAFVTNLPVPCLDQSINVWCDSTLAQDAFPTAQTCFRQFNLPHFTDAKVCLLRLKEVCALQAVYDADRMKMSSFQFA